MAHRDIYTEDKVNGGINEYFDRYSGLYMEKPGFKVAEQT